MIKKTKVVTKGAKENTGSSFSNKSRQFRKMSEYGRQLAEKQKVKGIYGIREKQFRRFFSIAKKSKDSAGSNLLTLLERRLDNAVFRLKFAITRAQARQMVVHGHFSVNNVKAFSPSMVLKQGDVISLNKRVIEKTSIVKDVVEKQFAKGTKVPEWLELDKAGYYGRLLRLPVREDIQASINENHIVELYSR
jgi:small subunit ribosomal protein S4